jgi:two-component system chemotaxis sensor kinase CheA
VVIRSLETNYRKIEGLAGATILGDGSVALIVDVPGLLASSRARPDRLAMAPSTTSGGNP